MKKNWKGLLLCLVIAAAGWYLGNWSLWWAVRFVHFVGNGSNTLLKDKTDLQPGITFTSKKFCSMQ